MAYRNTRQIIAVAECLFANTLQTITQRDGC